MEPLRVIGMQGCKLLEAMYAVCDTTQTYHVNYEGSRSVICLFLRIHSVSKSVVDVHPSKI